MRLVIACWLLLCFVQQLLAIVADTAAATTIELRWPPENFPKNRNFTNEDGHLGQDVEDVEPLGRIVKLKTLFDPTDIEALNTRFTIHTRWGSSDLMAFISNGFVYSNFSNERFHYNLTTMANSKFDGRKRTVIIVPGFLTDDSVDWMDHIKDLWLELDDCNVILVTWKKGNRYIYSRAAATTPRVARQITIFLDYLATMQQIEGSIYNLEFASRIQFIGHSLGSHIAGFVGLDLRGQMGRVLSLDPAGPSFDQFKREHRLDKSDARFVEVIHTNAGKMSYASLVKGGAKATWDKMLRRTDDQMSRSIGETFSGEGGQIWFGLDAPVGHIDYYANNGRTQPGCLGATHICDHARAYGIYEGLLEHEITLKARQPKNLEPELRISYESWRKNKRLLAVNAADYAGFASGETLNQRCPAMLHERDRLSGLAEKQMPDCTVPIDQLSPIDGLMRELSENYGIAFNNNSATDSESSSSSSYHQRYYFKTLTKQPYVGDHYLLRLKLERSSIWERNCSLQAEISFSNEQNTTIELDKELRLFTNGKFFGLSLPFVNLNGADARIALDKMLTKYTIENQNSNMNEIDEETEQLMGQILPSSIGLRVIENNQQQTTKSAFSKWTQSAQSGSKSSGSPRCQLAINSIQVHPLVEFRRSLFARYSNQRLSGSSIKMLSHLEYKRRKLTEKVLPETLNSANTNHERRLQLIVVG